MDWKTSDYTIIQIPFLRWNTSKMGVQDETPASVATFNFFILEMLSCLLGLLCLTSLLIIIHICRGGQFHWWRKPEYPEKIIDLSEVTDTHILLCRQYLARNGVRTHNFSGDNHGLYK